MNEISFKQLQNSKKEDVIIYLLNDNFECQLKKTKFNKIQVIGYSEAREVNDVNIITFKFFLPKKEPSCIKIYYGENKTDSSWFSILSKNKRTWHYRISDSNEEVTIITDELEGKLKEILEQSKNTIEIITDFFIQLGFSNIHFNRIVDKEKSLILNYENEVRDNG